MNKKNNNKKKERGANGRRTSRIISRRKKILEIIDIDNISTVSSEMITEDIEPVKIPKKRGRPKKNN